MCNLWTDRLFIIPNPCCCCTLKCGAIWAGIIDFLFGGISLLVPVAGGAGYDAPVDPNDPLNSNPTNGIILGERWMYLKDEPAKSFITYGCYSIQAVTGLYVAISIRCFASPMHKFIAGCIWLVGRTIITIIWLQILYAILGDDRNLENPSWRTFTYVLIVNLIFHAFLFIVIRYYTMEAFDSWKYRPIQPENSKRRGRARSDNDKSGNKHLDDVRKLKRQIELGQHHGRHQWEDAAVWRVQDEFALYGENYSHWDPERFYHQWERLKNTGILKLGEEEVFDEAEYRKIVNQDGSPSMQIEIVDEKKSNSRQPSEITVVEKEPAVQKKKHSTLTIKKGKTRKSDL